MDALKAFPFMYQVYLPCQHFTASAQIQFLDEYIRVEMTSPQALITTAYGITILQVICLAFSLGAFHTRTNLILNNSGNFLAAEFPHFLQYPFLESCQFHVCVAVSWNRQEKCCCKFHDAIHMALRRENRYAVCVIKLLGVKIIQAP